MEKYFDLVIFQDVFVEVRNGQLERVSRADIRIPVGERLPSPYCYYIRFLEYLYDESGAPIGAKFECDEGSGYYGNYGKTVETVRVGQTVEFTHNWTGVDDDGCPEDNCTDVKFQLLPHEAAKNDAV